MKKLIAMLLAVLTVVSLAACNININTNQTTTPNNAQTAVKGEVPASALALLEKVWGGYTDDEKFPCMGGVGEAMVDGAPGKFDLTDTDSLIYMLLVPEDQTGNITDAASLIHGMLANNFTCGAFRVKGDAKAFAEAMKTAVTGNRWMCGMPEKLLISIVGGEYVVVVFGINDAVNPFQTKLAAAYPEAEQYCLQDLG